jgi:maleate isomerase
MADAGFEVRGMDGIDVPFEKVQELSSRRIFSHIKRSFRQHKGADAIYMLGSGWRTLDIIAKLERDLGVPVVHPVTARAWEIEKRLNVRRRIKGYGHLLEKLP